MATRVHCQDLYGVIRLPREHLARGVMESVGLPWVCRVDSRFRTIA